MVKRLMTDQTYERQFCGNCKKICYCVETSSLNTDKKIKHAWLCEFCLGFIYLDAKKKDEMRAILIECGIEDIE